MTGPAVGARAPVHRDRRRWLDARIQARVDYLLPLGRVGNLAIPLVRHDLRRIFDYPRAAGAHLLG